MSERLNEQKSDAGAARIVQIARSRRPHLGRVLDVGCGTGQVLRAARNYADSLAGTDVEETFLEEARDALPGASLHLATIDRDLPFEAGSFDTVFFCDVIEHLHDPVGALGNLRSVAAPGGTLIVTTPNANALVRTLRPRAWFALADPSHLIFFTRFTLSHLLDRTGFTAIATKTIGGTGSRPVDTALELFGNGGTIVALARKPETKGEASAGER